MFSRGWDIMKSVSAFKEVRTPSNPKENQPEEMSELEQLQQMHGEKSSKIKELKTEIGLVKHNLENKKEIPDECEENFKALREIYDRLRNEYNALLLPRKRESGN